MKTTFELASLEAQIGPRGSATIAGAEARDKVRSWLQAKGVSRDTTSRLSMDNLRLCYNDTTDATLNSFKVPAAVGGTFPPAVTPPSDDGDKVESLLGQLRGLLTAKPSASLDENAVRSIVEPLVNPVSDRVNELADIVAPLADLAARVKADAGTAARLPLLAAAASGNHILDKLLRFYKAGSEQLIKVCVTAPPSFGKSFSIRLLGKAYDVFLEHGCSEDADEIATLLGSPVPDGAGGFIVVDGLLAEAVRAASSGKTVLLFLDEVFRLHPKAQEWLLAFLTGVKTPDGAIYRLRTRRADSGRLEVIECKAKNLHIVAASNLGLVKPVEAFWSRWHKLRLDWNLPDCSAVACAILDSYGITHTKKFGENFAKLIGESRNAAKAGQTSYPVDFRLLEAACVAAATPDEDGVRSFIKEHVVAQIANWDGDLGDTDPNAATTVKPWFKLID